MVETLVFIETERESILIFTLVKSDALEMEEYRIGTHYI